MSAMDHGAAHERIEDLMLEPARLAALDSSTDSADVALREHVADCATCRADLEAWRRLQRTLASALSGSAEDAAAAVDPIELPPSLRASVIGAARTGRAEPARDATQSDRRSRLARLLAIAAAFILVVGSVAAAIDQGARRSAAEAESQALTAALTAVDRILAEPAHKVVALEAPDGSSAGTISWSRHDWVVIATALDRPAADQTYLCWLVEEDRSILVGVMQFAGSTAFWVASVDKWATWEIGPTTRFIVTLQPDGGQQPAGPTLLEATLGA